VLQEQILKGGSKSNMRRVCKGIKHIKGKIYFFDLQADHKRLQVRKEANSDKEAKQIKNELLVELRKQLPISQQGEQERLNASFDEAREKLFADLRADNVSQTNILRHTIIFKRLFQDFRNLKFPHIKSPGQIPPIYLQEYKAYFINDLKHNPKGGWRSELICVKSMIRRLKRLGYCRKELVESLVEIPRPRHEKKEYPEIPNSKLKTLLDFIKKDRPDFYPPIYFMCRTGRRINETTLIEKRDVKWDGLNPIRIDIRAETTKTKEKAPIDRLDLELAEVIRQAYNASSKRKTVYLFCNRLGKRCGRNHVGRYLRDVSEKLIGIRITPHYLRHRFLTEAGKAGVPLPDAMHIAGIKDIKVVMGYYSHITNDGQDKVFAVSRI